MGALILLKLTQPPVETRPYTPMAYTGLNPYGVNTFLEQEVEEAKVRRSLQMIRDAEQARRRLLRQREAAEHKPVERDW